MSDTTASTPPPPASAPAKRRRLVRSRSDRLLGGVAGGIGETYGLDSALVRIVIAAGAVFTFGVVAVAYIVAWAVIPEAAPPGSLGTDATGRALVDGLRRRAEAHGLGEARGRGALWAGVALFVAGLFALGDAWPSGAGRLIGPLTLIALGAGILLYRQGGDAGLAGRAGEPSPPPASRAQSTADTPPVPGASADPSGSAFADTSTRSAYASGSWPLAPGPSLPEPPPARPRRPRRRSELGRLTWSALLVLVGAAWLLGLGGAIDVNPAVVLALALGLVGAALVVGAWFGRALHLIGLGIVLTAVASVAAAISVPLRGGIGERIYRPARAADVRAHYELGIGHLVVDLSRVPATGAPLRIAVRDGIGQAEIIVAADADVIVRGRVDAGNLAIPGAPDNDGWRVRSDARLPGTGARIEIDGRVGFGELRVRRRAPASVDAATRTTTSEVRP